MLVDSPDIAGQGRVEADVCIVGGGAAGLALALGLLDAPLRVVLVEGGGLRATDVPRNPYRVLAGAHARPTLGTDPSKGWYLGGNTNTWSANCRPLDASDFEARPWIPNSGWPIERDELIEYYRRAQSVLGLGELRWYDSEQCRPHLAQAQLDVDPSVLATRINQVCPIPSLAARHRQAIAESTRLQVILQAEAVQLLTDDSASTVTGVEVACSDGRRAQVVATSVVLAGGAIENARILLASRSVNPRGLANDHDLVGRFFMEHWWVDLPLGDWGRGADVDLYNPHGHQTVDGTAVWAELALSEPLLREQQLPALAVWLAQSPWGTASIAAARMLALSLLGRVPLDPITDLRLAGTDVLEAPRYFGRALASRFGTTDRAGYSLWVQLEQTPDPENRVRLGTTEDELGRPTAELDLRLGEADLQGAERGLEIAAAELGLNAARLAKQLRLSLAGRRYDFFWHHMGTTRMADDPTQGVVDRNCRAHGLTNLFVAGSSVFPTSGSAAPTLTIVALALRLADHLARLS